MEGDKMKYSEFINNNLDALQQNYKSRLEFIYETPFFEYCDFIYTGLTKGLYIPDEHKKNITIGE